MTPMSIPATSSTNHAMPSGALALQAPGADAFQESDPPTLCGTTLRDCPPLRGEWALIRYMGNPVGEVLSLRESGLTLGRARDNLLCLSESEVSRYHARIELVSQGDLKPMVMLADLGSTNGTHVNGQRIDPGNGPISLQNGDVIRVGTHAFKLKHMDGLERNYHDAVLVQTTVDHLTGLGNRASVMGFMDKHTDLARRHHRPLSVIICDLDHFKAVNDDHGHAVGDRALKAFALVVSGRLRVSDYVGRIGGEEFLVVLPETEGRKAQALAEELRLAVAAEPLIIRDQGPGLHLTCCFGVVQVGVEDTDSGKLLARADAALYRAKALGRNRVEFDGPP